MVADTAKLIVNDGTGKLSASCKINPNVAIRAPIRAAIVSRRNRGVRRVNASIPSVIGKVMDSLRERSCSVTSADSTDMTPSPVSPTSHKPPSLGKIVDISACKARTNAGVPLAMVVIRTNADDPLALIMDMLSKFQPDDIKVLALIGPADSTEDVKNGEQNESKDSVRLAIAARGMILLLVLRITCGDEN